MVATVYSKPSCPQCDATKRQFTKLGLPFEVVDVTQNQQAADQLRAAGFQQLPVVIAGNNVWSGYRPDRIKQLASILEPATR